MLISEYWNKNSRDVGMTNEELNTRAFMSTIKQAENHFNDSLPYNAKHGFTKGKLNTLLRSPMMKHLKIIKIILMQIVPELLQQRCLPVIKGVI